MSKLRRQNGELFRAKCGDGFIGSILAGADLYVLFHFHDLNEKMRVELETAIKASAGIGDVFSGSGSSSLSAVFQNKDYQSRTTIQFVQQGGQIQSLPIALADAQHKVSILPEEARNGPRPIYMVIVPYTELPELRPIPIFNVEDPRQRAMRYYERLISVYFEILNIEADYYRDRRGSDISPDGYYYSYKHLLRSEMLPAIRDSVMEELKLVGSIVRDFDRKECNAWSTAMTCKGFRPNTSADGEKCAYVPNDKTCQTLGARLEMTDFDDLKYWIQLPIPANAIPDAAKSFIETPANGLGARQDTYAQYLFRHWIERIVQIRCRMFYECATSAQRDGYFQQIKTSLTSITPGASPITLGNPGGGAPVNMAVSIAPGYSATVTDEQTDTTPNAYDLYVRNDGGSWQLLDKTVHSSRGNQKEFAGSPDGMDIGTFGYLCYGVPATDCTRPALGPRFLSTGIFSAEIWYFDPGETQSQHHDLAIKISVSPSAPFFPN